MAISFTEEQQKIINHESGHALVSSVAGSGKSTVLQYRVEHLVDKRSAQPWSIGVLMYNRFARDQFEEELTRVMGNTNMPQVWTFHSFGQKMLGRLCDLMGVFPPEVMNDEAFWVDMLTETAYEHNEVRLAQNLDPHIIHRDRARDILEHISLLKNFGHPHLPLPQWMMEDERMLLAIELFGKFEDKRKESQYVALDDLLYDAFRLAFEHEDLMETYLEDFPLKYIIVDEYQDSNAIQQWLLRKIASKGAEVMVVGDDDQSIYGWRGADPMYMLHQFAQDFPGTKTYSLTKTFRYGHSVSLMANHLLKENKQRFQKQCFSLPTHSTRVEILSGAREDVLLQKALSTIPRKDYSDTVALVRHYSQLDTVELELLRQGIPVDVDVDRMFVNRRDGKMVRDLMTWVCNPKALPDPKSVVSLFKFINEEAEGEWCRDVARQVGELGWKEGMQHVFTRMGKNMFLSTTMARSNILLDKISGLNERSRASDFLAVLYSFYDNVRRKPDAPQREVESAWKVLMNCLVNMNVQQSLSWMSSLHPTAGGILLTSVHKAKGGGWKHVILPGLQEGVFPEKNCQEMEEERRLFYVAITRAKSSLYIMVPDDPGFTMREQQKIDDDRWKLRVKDPDHPLIVSRFLYESAPAVSMEAQRLLMSGAPVEARWRTVNNYAEKVFPETHNGWDIALKGLLP